MSNLLVQCAHAASHGFIASHKRSYSYTNVKVLPGITEALPSPLSTATIYRAPSAAALHNARALLDRTRCPGCRPSCGCEEGVVATVATLLEAIPRSYRPHHAAPIFCDVATLTDSDTQMSGYLPSDIHTDDASSAEELSDIGSVESDFPAAGDGSETEASESTPSNVSAVGAVLDEAAIQEDEGVGVSPLPLFDDDDEEADVSSRASLVKYDAGEQPQLSGSVATFPDDDSDDFDNESSYDEYFRDAARGLTDDDGAMSDASVLTRPGAPVDLEIANEALRRHPTLRPTTAALHEPVRWGIYWAETAIGHNLMPREEAELVLRRPWFDPYSDDSDDEDETAPRQLLRARQKDPIAAMARLINPR